MESLKLGLRVNGKWKRDYVLSCAGHGLFLLFFFFCYTGDCLSLIFFSLCMYYAHKNTKHLSKKDNSSSAYCIASSYELNRSLE